MREQSEKKIPCILADAVGLGHLEVRGGQRAWAGGRADPEARSQQPATRAAPALPFSRRGESEAFGKAKLQALVAVMRKLLHAAWGMFRNDQPYDGAKLCPQA